MDGIYWVVMAAAMGLAFTLTWAVWLTISRSRSSEKFDEALEIIQSSEITELDGDREEDVVLSGGWSWNKWWYQAAIRAGRTPSDSSSPGRFALGGTIVGALFGFLVFPGGLIGLLIAPIMVVAVGQAWLSYEASKRRAAMDAQMPLLLSSLRSQMHAGVTVQGALMNIADDLPSPLGDEVRQVKRDVNVSIPLDQALSALAQRVPSQQMQFLVSSIGIAVKSGSDLVPQLITIEEIAQQRARITAKIKSATALAKPTAILAAVAPIVLVIYFFFSDPAYLNYFFGPGLFVLLIAVLLYVGGIVTIRMLIKNVENVG